MRPCSLNFFLHSEAQYYVNQAVRRGAERHKVQPGSVTFLQRFGSSSRWPPAMIHCYGDMPILPPWCSAHHFGHYPREGDDANIASPQSGVRAAANCPCPTSPSDSRLRRSHCQRRLVGSVRAVAVSVSAFRLPLCRLPGISRLSPSRRLAVEPFRCQP